MIVSTPFYEYVLLTKDFFSAFKNIDKAFVISKKNYFPNFAFKLVSMALRKSSVVK